MNRNTTNSFKRSLFIACMLIVVTVVFSLIVRYYVIGESNLPYSLEKILIVSTVSGESGDGALSGWDIKLKEANDVYITINKKDEKSKETIKSISLENFRVTSPSVIGKVVVYRPTGDLKNLYLYSDENYLGKTIEYKGAAIDTMKTLEVRNEGGTIGFRAALEELGTYISRNLDEKITYTGDLLKKAGTELDEIRFELAFDIAIKLSNHVTYKGTVTLNLPNEDIMTNPDSHLEITDFSNVVFKRD